MDSRFMSTVILFLIFVLLGVAPADHISFDDPVDKEASDRVVREAELADSPLIEDAETRVERNAVVVGVVVAVARLGLDVINIILNNLPDPVTRTCVVSIRNFLDTKALVNPVVYTKASKMKGIPPERIGPGQATVLEFDQAGKDEKPEGSFVYNIEGTDLYVTVLFHVAPPNIYNARILKFKTTYSDVKVNLHSGMQTEAELYPLIADDTIQYDIRQECGYKVSVIMTDHERASLQVDVYDCQDTIDKTVLVVANQTAHATIVDPLGCEPGDLPRCGCCQTISRNYTDSLPSSSANYLSTRGIIGIAVGVGVVVVVAIVLGF